MFDRMFIGQGGKTSRPRRFQPSIIDSIVEAKTLILQRKAGLDGSSGPCSTPETGLDTGTWSQNSFRPATGLLRISDTVRRPSRRTDNFGFDNCGNELPCRPGLHYAVVCLMQSAGIRPAPTCPTRYTGWFLPLNRNVMFNDCTSNVTFNFQRPTLHAHRHEGPPTFNREEHLHRPRY